MPSAGAKRGRAESEEKPGPRMAGRGGPGRPRRRGAVAKAAPHAAVQTDQKHGWHGQEAGRTPRAGSCGGGGNLCGMCVPDVLLHREAGGVDRQGECGQARGELRGVGAGGGGRGPEEGGSRVLLGGARGNTCPAPARLPRPRLKGEKAAGKSLKY